MDCQYKYRSAERVCGRNAWASGYCKRHTPKKRSDSPAAILRRAAAHVNACRRGDQRDMALNIVLTVARRQLLEGA